MERDALLLGVLAVFLVVAPGAHAGSASDPEIVDPPGDVRVEDVVPVSAGAEWADVLALWYEHTDGLRMKIRVQTAESIPPPGELGALIAINGTFFMTGYTTVLAPFAVPMYQGGFICPATQDGQVDPATCQTKADVSLEAGILDVPLGDEFGITSGSIIETSYAYSGAWYLDVKTTFDKSGPGRQYVIETHGDQNATLQPERVDPDQDAPATPQETMPEKEAPAPFLIPAIVLPYLLAMRRRRSSS